MKTAAFPFRIPAVLSALLVGVSWAAAAEAQNSPSPRVVASIKPIHSLVAGVMEGVGTPKLIVRGSGSPHAYTLRPSDARALSRAALIFWVGAPLETFLEKPLAALGGEARIVSLAEVKDVLRLAPRGEGEKHEATQRNFDPHLWLDPANAAAMARAIGRALAGVDPDRESTYRRNVQRLERRLTALEQSLGARLAPLAGRPYVVFHDGYRYLERRFALPAVAAITPSPEHLLGARRLAEIRALVRRAGVRCVFGEARFASRLEATVVEGTAARLASLDPLGAALEEGPELYFSLMNGQAAALVGCLSGGG